MLGPETARRHPSPDKEGESSVRAAFACLDRLTFLKLISETPDQSGPHAHHSAVRGPRQPERAQAEAAIHLRALEALKILNIHQKDGSTKHHP